MELTHPNLVFLLPDSAINFLKRIAEELGLPFKCVEVIFYNSMKVL